MNRRGFLKVFLAATGTAAGLAAVAMAAAEKPEEQTTPQRVAAITGADPAARPNIVLILADDLGAEGTIVPLSLNMYGSATQEEPL